MSVFADLSLFVFDSWDDVIHMLISFGQTVINDHMLDDDLLFLHLRPDKVSYSAAKA